MFYLSVIKIPTNPILFLPRLQGVIVTTYCLCLDQHKQIMPPEVKRIHALTCNTQLLYGYGFGKRLVGFKYV